MTTPQSPAESNEQREAVLESQRNANQGQPRNFKEDALTEKVVTVEPDGTGPTSTGTFDTDTDQALGSGNEEGQPQRKPEQP
jgi:hypothetical protein